MQIKLKIVTTEGEVLNPTATVPDFIAWERYSKRKVSDFANGAGIEDMAFLAWNSLKRTQKTELNFEQWVEIIAELEAVDEDPKATKKGR